jgi:hypothetical protein
MALTYRKKVAHKMNRKTATTNTTLTAPVLFTHQGRGSRIMVSIAFPSK